MTNNSKTRLMSYQHQMVSRVSGLLKRQDGQSHHNKRDVFCALIVAFTSLLSNHGVNAQAKDIQTVVTTFNCNGFHDLLSKVYADKKCKFVIYKGDKVVWIQQDGEVVFDLLATSVEGKWKNVVIDGSIVYRFQFENKGDGRLTISRKDNVYKILFDLKGLERGDILNEYEVSDIVVN